MHKKRELVFLTTYDNNADALFRHIFFRVHDRELARDLLQETFTRVWQYLGDGNVIDNLKAFLYKTAHNLIIDQYRKHKESSLDDMAQAGFDPEDHNTTNSVYAGAEIRQFLNALKKIPEEYSQVLLMRYVDDMSPEDIAEILDETPNTISVRIHRGMAMVRKELGLETS